MCFLCRKSKQQKTTDFTTENYGLWSLLVEFPISSNK